MTSIHRDLMLAGELEALKLREDQARLLETAPPNRDYPNSYTPGGENPLPKLSLWARAKNRFHSWNLERKIKSGAAPRGRTE